MKDTTIVYYTSNFLDTENPYFLANTKRQLVRAIGDFPLIVISHKEVAKESFPEYKGTYLNLVAGRDFELWKPGERHHLNLYQQIMIGSDNAKTKYVAMAEDDILYSYEHFHSPSIEKHYRDDRQVFLYDMNKLSLFTWNRTPMFSFRSRRKVVNQLISPAKYLSDAMHERFERVDYLLKKGKPLESILHVFGDPGRYENQLGVTIREMEEYYCDMPSIVFSHPKAYGFLNHGKRKRLGDIKIIELYGWGRADKMLNEIWGNYPRE